MNAWTEAGLKATLDDSDKLLVAAHELGMALSAGSDAILPDDVLTALRQLTYIIERMQHTVVITKVQVMHRPGKSGKFENFKQ